MEDSSRIEVGRKVLVQCSDYQGLASVAGVSRGVLRIRLLQRPARGSLEIGQKARVKSWDEQGIYFHSGEITQLGGEGQSEVELSMGGDPVAIQRRGSFRVRAGVAIAFRVTEAAHTGLESGRIYELETQNIGAGGLSFDTSLPLKEMDQLALELHLAGRDLSLHGTVVTSERVERGGRFVNAIGVEFFDLSPDTRQGLMDYLMGVEGMAGN